MHLSNLVKTYMQSEELKIYDVGGVYVSPIKIRNEYNAIKNYLLITFESNQIIGINIKKDYKYLLLVLASIEIGLTYVPMNNDWPLDRIRQIESIASINKIIDDNLIFNILQMQFLEDINKKFEIKDSNPLYIIFTSGSTGEPKGVAIKRECLKNFFDWCDFYFWDINSSDSLLQVTDFSFDVSLVDVGMLLTKHLTIYFSKFKDNIFELAYEIEKYHISLVSTVPNNINMLLADSMLERINLNSLKNVFIGGARFSYGLYQKLIKETNMNIYNFYGPTEVTVYCLVKKITRVEEIDIIDHNVSIGTAISNVKVKIMNLHENVGELYLGGIQVMKEYVSNPLKTNGALLTIDNETYYRTGDLAFSDKKGEYYIVGRIDDTIKRKGYRINLQDIDSYIQRIYSIIECTSIAIPDEIIENKVITFLILKDDSLLKVKNEMKKYLATYQIPDQVIEIDNFPTNNSGKICKKTLKEIYLNNKRIE